MSEYPYRFHGGTTMNPRQSSSSERFSSFVFLFLVFFSEQLIEEKGAVNALCAALACITGRTEAMPVRSLLSNSEGYVTAIFRSDHPIEYMAYCWTAIRRVMSSAASDNIRGMQVRSLARSL